MSEKVLSIVGWEKLGCGQHHHIVVSSKDRDTRIFLDGKECEIIRDPVEFEGFITKFKKFDHCLSEEEIKAEYEKQIKEQEDE